MSLTAFNERLVNLVVGIGILFIFIFGLILLFLIGVCALFIIFLVVLGFFLIFLVVLVAVRLGIGFITVVAEPGGTPLSSLSEFLPL